MRRCLHTRPRPPPIVYTWTGCYLGLHSGGGRSTNDWDHLDLVTPPIVFATVRSNGFLGGAQVGCDYQVGGAWVFGIEGQFAWSNIHGQALIPPQGAPAQVLSKIDRFATATGRIGYAFERALLYTKSGFAWAHFNQEWDIAPVAAFVPAFLGTQGIVGWTAGVGVEVAFLPNLSWKVEYSYFDFGTNGVPLSPAAGGTPVPFNIKSNMQTVLFGLNYRFGLGAVYAKY